MAQSADWHYGWWFVDDEEDDWYYWFTADVVIVDETWIVYGSGQLHRGALKGGHYAKVRSPALITSSSREAANTVMST